MRAIARSPAARNLEDDAAVIEIGGETLVLTQDSMAEGVHWLPGTDMAHVAWKLVAVNLSDLAAKGAEPVGVLLGYSLGEGDARFLEGLREVCERYDVTLLGGDTIRADGPRTLGLTAIGRATHTPVPARSGATMGDGVYLCGTIGDAYRGYTRLTAENPAPALTERRTAASLSDTCFIERFLRPRPLLEEGQALAPQVTAMMDVSDGLFLDAQRMASASNVTIALDFASLPFSQCFRADGGEDRLQRLTAAGWGDDYALLFTMPPGVEPAAPSACIGEIRPLGEHALLLDNQPLPSDAHLGFTH